MKHYDFVAIVASPGGRLVDFRAVPSPESIGL
jgi:hypothetical protein